MGHARRDHLLRIVSDLSKNASALQIFVRELALYPKYREEIQVVCADFYQCVSTGNMDCGYTLTFCVYVCVLLCVFVYIIVCLYGCLFSLSLSLSNIITHLQILDRRKETVAMMRGTQDLITMSWETQQVRERQCLSLNVVLVF